MSAHWHKNRHRNPAHTRVQPYQLDGSSRWSIVLGSENAPACCTMMEDEFDTRAEAEAQAVLTREWLARTGGVERG